MTKEGLTLAFLKEYRDNTNDPLSEVEETRCFDQDETTVEDVEECIPVPLLQTWSGSFVAMVGPARTCKYFRFSR